MLPREELNYSSNEDLTLAFARGKKPFFKKPFGKDTWMESGLARHLAELLVRTKQLFDLAEQLNWT